MENNLYKSNLNDYADKRRDIADDNSSSCFYRKLGFNNLTPNESRLEELMKQNRENYRILNENMQMPFPAAQPFYEAKDTISSSILYEVFRLLPKWSLLHVHSSAALSVEGLMELLEVWSGQANHGRETDWCIYVFIKEDLVQNKYAPGTLRYYGHIPAELKALDNFNDYAVPVGEFINDSLQKGWLLELLSMRSRRVEQFPYIWDEFNTIFSRTSDIFTCKEFYYEYHVRFFLECADDNISYVELRCGFEQLQSSRRNANELSGSKDTGADSDSNYVEMLSGYNYTKYLDYRELSILTMEDCYKALSDNNANVVLDTVFIDVIQKALEEANGRLSDAGRKIDARVILCARRSLDPDVPQQKNKLLLKVDMAIAMKQLYPDFIIGFDFVSEEDRGFTSDQYKDIIYGDTCSRYDMGAMSPAESNMLECVKNTLRGLGDNVPRINMINFYLHAGESNWNDNVNSRDASVMSRYRIGHGFNMNKIQGCVRGIAFIDGAVQAQPMEPMLEICPISNQLLRYYTDLRNHPAYELMMQGIGCVVCNDDPQLLGNKGLSYDFWEMYVGMWLDLNTIKGLTYNAYHYYITKGKPVGGGQDNNANEHPRNADGIEQEFAVQWEAFVNAALERFDAGAGNED